MINFVKQIRYNTLGESLKTFQDNLIFLSDAYLMKYILSTIFSNCTDKYMTYVL